MHNEFFKIVMWIRQHFADLDVSCTNIMQHKFITVSLLLNNHFPDLKLCDGVQDYFARFTKISKIFNFNFLKFFNIKGKK